MKLVMREFAKYLFVLVIVILIGCKKKEIEKSLDSPVNSNSSKTGSVVFYTDYSLHGFGACYTDNVSMGVSLFEPGTGKDLGTTATGGPIVSLTTPSCGQSGALTFTGLAVGKTYTYYSSWYYYPSPSASGCQGRSYSWSGSIYITEGCQSILLSASNSD